MFAVAFVAANRDIGAMCSHILSRSASSRLYGDRLWRLGHAQAIVFVKDLVPTKSPLSPIDNARHDGWRTKYSSGIPGHPR